MNTMTRLALTAGLLLTPATALACGGFFCSQANPVDQAGEHILFAVDGNDVTAHIQIKYQGAAESFSWVLPMPSTPDFAVGTDVLFARLRANTDPRFEIEWDETGDCKVNNDCMFASPEADGGDPDDDGGGGVNVVKEGEVGPYTYKVIEATDGASLFKWLNDNGYDQPPTAEGLIGHYVNQSFSFVALKLQKGKTAGDLQPLVVKYTSETLACIPLKLTSIAAAEDMPVFSWVLAKARAVPMNYFHVVLNAKAYDWLSCATPAGWGWGWGGFGGVDCAKAYLDLVTKAANVANGHAFVTEFAGASTVMAEKLYKEGQFDLKKLETVGAPKAYMQEMMSQQIPQGPLTQQVIREAIPKPDDADLPESCQGDSNFYAFGKIDECVKHMPPGWSFDPVKTTADIKERIVDPLIAAEKLFANHPYLTRMFTTISPDEMTKDPVFSFNPDLPDISNVHGVKAKAICKEGSTTEAEKVILTFPNGETKEVVGTFQSCGPFLAEDDGGAAEPAYADIQVMNESGDPVSIAADDVNEKEAEIDVRAPDPEQSDVEKKPPEDTPKPEENPNSGTFGTPGENPLPTTGGESQGEESSSCQAAATTAPTGPPIGLLLVFGLSLALCLRSRRPRLVPASRRAR